jgi:aryl-alcohol dehydrogenase-like predicted oxidoreductase
MKLALGTAQIGFNYGLLKKKIKPSEIKKIKNFLEKSYLRFSVIDTSMNYGKSQKIIGNLSLKKLRIVTKIRMSSVKKKNIEQWVLKKIKNTLNDLKSKNIYGLLIHDYKDLLSARGKIFLKLLQNLKKRKIIKKIGISIYDPTELDQTEKIFKPDIVQMPFNVFDQRIDKSGWLKKLKKKKVQTYARSCFLQGLLINYARNQKIKKKFKAYKSVLNFWFRWCSKNNITPLNACLSFIKQQKNIDYLLIGFDNLPQLKEIVKNFNQKSRIIPNIFSNSDLNLIDPRNWYN